MKIKFLIDDPRNTLHVNSIKIIDLDCWNSTIFPNFDASTLSTLQNGTLRKGALRFHFLVSILLECINLKLLTNKYSFISSWQLSHQSLNQCDDFIGRSTCCLGANAFLLMFKYLSFFFARSLAPWQMVTQCWKLPSVLKRYQTGKNRLFMIIWWLFGHNWLCDVICN